MMSIKTLDYNIYFAPPEDFTAFSGFGERCQRRVFFASLFGRVQLTAIVLGEGRARAALYIEWRTFRIVRSRMSDKYFGRQQTKMSCVWSG
jgi:hypothetical protein